MSIYCCDTHRITIEIDGNKRTTKVSLGIRGTNQCFINKAKVVIEGTHNECIIRKIKD